MISNQVVNFTEATIVLSLPEQKSSALHRHCLSIHALSWQALFTPLTFSVSSFILFLTLMNTFYPPVPCSFSHKSSMPESAQIREKKKLKTLIKQKVPLCFSSEFCAPPFQSPLLNKATQTSQKRGFPRNPN